MTKTWKPWMIDAHKWIAELKVLRAAGPAKAGEARKLAYAIEDLIALYDGPAAARGWAAAWK